METKIYQNIEFYPIANFSKYFISKCGKIYSEQSRNGIDKRILTNKLEKHGYLRVDLHKDKIQYPRNVHRLVAETFIPTSDINLTVDHINRIKTDNRLENLQWATKREQQLNRNMLKTNKSGHTGVFFTKSNGYEYWAACWRPSLNTNPKKKQFGIITYGYDEALKLAIEYREQMVEKYYKRE